MKRLTARVAAVAAVGGVLAQIGHPLVSGEVLTAATVTSVVLLATAALAHATARWGPRAAGVLLLAAGGTGLAVETLGVHTGFPFGAYSYAGTLGPQLLGVPAVVPLAWLMLAYPSLLMGRRLARAGAGRRPSGLVTAGAGGIGLAGWDLFLDPQMVAQGHWSWQHPTPALPGVPGVPLTNYAGWLLVAVVMIAVLDRVLPADTEPYTGPITGPSRTEPSGTEPSQAVPAGVLAWTWAGSTLGNLAFFDRPWVALYGGLAMGAVVVPYLIMLNRMMPTARRATGPGRAIDPTTEGGAVRPRERTGDPR